MAKEYKKRTKKEKKRKKKEQAVATSNALAEECEEKDDALLSHKEDYLK